MASPMVNSVIHLGRVRSDGLVVLLDIAASVDCAGCVYFMKDPLVYACLFGVRPSKNKTQRHDAAVSPWAMTRSHGAHRMRPEQGSSPLSYAFRIIVAEHSEPSGPQVQRDMCSMDLVGGRAERA